MNFSYRFNILSSFAVIALCLFLTSCGDSDVNSNPGSTLEASGSFSEGLAPVKKSGKWGFMNSSGEIVVTPVFGSVGWFENGCAPARKNGLWGLIDTTGTVIMDHNFLAIGHFSGGLAPVLTLGRDRMLWGYLNSSGDFVIDPQFDQAGDFSEGLAAVRVNNEYRYIDTNGATVFTLHCLQAHPFYEGMARIRDANGRFGFIGADGQYLIQPVYEDAGRFSQGLAPVKTNGMYGYIDATGATIIKPEYKSAMPFQDGVAAVSNSEKPFYIDLSGQVCLSNESWVHIFPFSDGVAMVASDQGTYQYVDKNGFPVGIGAWVPGETKPAILSGDNPGLSSNLKEGLVLFQVLNLTDISWNLQSTSTKGNAVMIPGFVSKLDTGDDTSAYTFLSKYDASGDSWTINLVAPTNTADQDLMHLSINSTVKAPPAQEKPKWWQLVVDGLQLMSSIWTSTEFPTQIISCFSNGYKLASGLVDSAGNDNMVASGDTTLQTTLTVDEGSSSLTLNPVADFISSDNFTLSDGSDYAIEMVGQRTKSCVCVIQISMYKYNQFYAHKCAQRLRQWYQDPSGSYNKLPWSELLGYVFDPNKAAENTYVVNNTYMKSLSSWSSDDIQNFWVFIQNFNIQGGKQDQIDNWIKKIGT